MDEKSRICLSNYVLVYLNSSSFPWSGLGELVSFLLFCEYLVILYILGYSAKGKTRVFTNDTNTGIFGVV